MFRGCTHVPAVFVFQKYGDVGRLPLGPAYIGSNMEDHAFFAVADDVVLHPDGLHLGGGRDGRVPDR